MSPSLALRSEQACKECTRRHLAASCDKNIPQCGTCVRAHRHCLYERYARTPLTRRHLTEVEMKLERAEALLREHGISFAGSEKVKTTSNAVSGDKRPRIDAPFSNGPSASNNHLNSANSATPFPIEDENGQKGGPKENDNSIGPSSNGQVANTQIRYSTPGQQPSLTETYDVSVAGIPLPRQGTPPLTGVCPQSHTGTFASTVEKPPAAPEDLAWDEQAKPMVFGDAWSWREHTAQLASSQDEDGLDHILDGMAILSVDGRDIGYVGVASGAAFLRYLYQPSEGRKRPANPEKERLTMVMNEEKTRLETSIDLELDPRQLIADSFVDAYFSVFHVTLPILHEPTFRAILYGHRPEPPGTTWKALANIVAAIGAFSAMTECLSVDTPVFYAAKSALSMDCLETGSLMLVQVLTLMSYYFQKRNKPNSGYTYVGLAARMAFGLGLHREFLSWKLAPHTQEVRRRVFWSVFIVDASICVTLSRPFNFVSESTDIPLPLNVPEDAINESTTSIPQEHISLTTNSSIRTGATFYLAAETIYKRLIKHPYPDLDELIRLDDKYLMTWRDSQHPSLREDISHVPESFAITHLIARCRYQNLKMVMFRPFLLPLLQKTSGLALPPSNCVFRSEAAAYARCMAASQSIITAVSEFWQSRPQTRLAAWYILYFSFQATLIPLVCLRTAPSSAEAHMWRSDIRTALSVIEDIRFIHGRKCAAVIHELADQFMGIEQDYSCWRNEKTTSNIESNGKTFGSQAPIHEMQKPAHWMSKVDEEAGRVSAKFLTSEDFQTRSGLRYQQPQSQPPVWDDDKIQTGRTLETQDFSMLFPTNGQFDLESDAAWHMVWPDANSAMAEDMFGIETEDGIDLPFSMTDPLITGNS